MFSFPLLTFCRTRWSILLPRASCFKVVVCYLVVSSWSSKFSQRSTENLNLLCLFFLVPLALTFSIYSFSFPSISASSFFHFFRNPPPPTHMQLTNRMPKEAVDAYTYDVLRRSNMRVLDTNDKVFTPCHVHPFSILIVLLGGRFFVILSSSIFLGPPALSKCLPFRLCLHS